MNGKYFLLNKRIDYERGYMEGLSIKKGKLSPLALSGEPMRFISRVFDSREKELEWHRLTIGWSGRQPSGNLVIYTSEDAQVALDGKKAALSELIRDDHRSFDEKMKVMAPFQKAVVPVSPDIWLHGIKGRYLWFVLELLSQEEKFTVSDFTLYFPAASWVAQLPEIYEQEDENGFLDRYLGIFQSMYEDMTRNIAGVPGLFDVDAAEGEFLVWMAEWLDFDEGHIWSKKQLRWLLKNAFRLSRRRGTRRSVEHFVRLYTGEWPVVVEWRQYRDVPRDERLYRDDPYTLMVFVREETLHSEKEKRTLIHIIEDVMPVYLSLELVVLKPYLFLDNHTYIGLNSRIGQYRPGRLDGHLALSFSTLTSQGDMTDDSTVKIDEIEGEHL